MKTRQKLLFSIAIIFLVIPLLTYFFKFRNPLSDNPQDWAAFGSYLGGVYSALFGFLSVLVLVATLREMRNANRHERENSELQLSNAMATKKLQDVIQLTEMIHKIMDNNPTITDKDSLPHYLAMQVHGFCRQQGVNDKEGLYKAAQGLMHRDKNRFSSEIHVLAQLIKSIASIKDIEQEETAKAVVKGLLSDSFRFWLYCYAQVWNPEAQRYFLTWPDFHSVPEELEHFLL